MRRRALPLLPLLLAAPALAQGSGEPALDALATRLAGLPGESGLLVQAEGPRGTRRAALRHEAPLFVGSALKSCILAAWLREVEAGRLALDAQLAVDDGHRSLVSPVLGELAGTTTARSVLEAMIAHSDNTATDIALARVGAPRVRALIAEAGMEATQLPTSTRRMFSALAGAPPGTDLGWQGVLAAVGGRMPGPPRPAINPVETMVSTPRDLVQWYRRALAGEFFASPASLAEFKRISAMADAMPIVAPPDVAAYGKGGSIDWNGFQAICVAGQAVSQGVRVTFCVGVNWPGEADSVPPVVEALRDGLPGAIGACIAALA